VKPPDAAAAACPRPPLKAIAAIVAKEADIAVPRLHGRERHGKVARIRQLAFWVARHVTAKSHEKIGRQIGRRDHQTVIHGCRRMEAALAADPELAALRDRVLARIEAWRPPMIEVQRLEAMRQSAHAANARAMAEASRRAEPSGVAWYEPHGSDECRGGTTPKGKFIEQDEAYIAAVLKAHPELRGVARGAA